MANNRSKLLEFCSTERQKEIVTLYASPMTIKEVADALGIHKRNVERALQRVKNNAAKMGYSPKHDMTRPVPDGFVVKGVSTYYDEDGNPKAQWVKSQSDPQFALRLMRDAVDDFVSSISSPVIPTPSPSVTQKDLLNLYVLNDLHVGALMFAEETLDRDYNLKEAERISREASEFLVGHSPAADTALVVDLGDLLEMDDFKNATPKSGHNLDVDGRYSFALTTAMQIIVNMISTALEKHKKVVFMNIEGNHDATSAHAIRSFVSAWFRNEPRVEVDTGLAFQKYYLHGSTLLGFAHGDGLKMAHAGEVMTMHNQHRFSETQNRYFHFGHNHKDSVIDGRICKAESHRNLAPLNAWAAHAGFGRQVGTMKCITYHDLYGEVNRTIYNVKMKPTIKGLIQDEESSSDNPPDAEPAVCL